MGKGKINNLTAYVLTSNFWIVADSKNKVIKLSEDGINYFPMKSFFSRYVRASTPDENSQENISVPPKVGEYLVTTRFFGFSSEVSIYPIKTINKNFQDKEISK